MTDAAVTTAPLWVREFPDMPLEAIPALPDGWEDESWHNDVCPSFHNKEAGIVLWVDFPEREQREFPEMCRLTLTRVAEDPYVEEQIISYEDWADMRAELDARGLL